MNIESIRENAWSFSTVDPPTGAELLATEDRNGERFFFYTNPDPEDAKDRPYLYETESGYIFKAKMAAAIKINREKERKKRCDA